MSIYNIFGPIRTFVTEWPSNKNVWRPLVRNITLPCSYSSTANDVTIMLSTLCTEQPKRVNTHRKD